HHLLNGDEELSAREQDEIDDIVADIPMFEFGGEDDYQLQQAVNYLEGRPVKQHNAAKIAAKKGESNKKADDKQTGDEPEKKNDAAAKPDRLSGSEKVERYRVGPDGLIRLDDE